MDVNKEVEVVSNMVNNMTFDYSGFCSGMAREHRALQENFTHLCMEWLATCGKEDYCFDARNQYSHIIGKKFVEMMKGGDV